MNHSFEEQNNEWVHNWRHPQYRRISMGQANEIALQRVPGEVVKSELEFDDGMLVYEVDIRTAEGHKYEVKVDAVTGNVVRVKRD
ncbi:MULTISPECIES: PepSY domain-containing protein [unclassified Sporosarcina]|uniref:PepSY domain-containing protein n=1 Tax=unclassified Sporosarcina TaxID=2647733 RepID=UPI0018DC65AD|nr:MULTISPECIES: PepSY domain-containing protein [unclassified Sporosarcina]